MKPSEFKMKSGINFSTLARNASKFYNTKIIGIDNASLEVSPIKTSKNSFSKKTPSPKWMKPNEKVDKKSKDGKLGAGSSSGKPQILDKCYKQGSAKTEDTNITLSNIDSKIDQALKLQTFKSHEQREYSKMESISLFSRNHLDNNMASDESKPFSADVDTINQEWMNQSHESPLKKEYQSVVNIFAFKNETFDNGGGLNRSSPIKEPLKVLSNKNINMNDSITLSIENKQDIISIHDDYQMIVPEPFNLNLTESRSKFDRMRDFKSGPVNENIVANINLKTSLQSQHESKTNSRTSSIEKSHASIEGLPLMLSSAKKCNKLKFTESRDQLSDKVSKFYFQKQTGFALENEGFNLGK
jgi:hypothetical protein